MREYEKALKENSAVCIFVKENVDYTRSQIRVSGFVAVAIDRNTEEKWECDFATLDAVYKHAKSVGFRGDLKMFLCS